MTGRFTRCRYCPRPLTSEESQRRGYGEKCGRDRGLIPPRRLRRAPRRSSKPASVPPAPDALAGQDQMPLFWFEATLESL